MKYLKKYKLFESFDTVITELQDLSVELIDLGFMVEISEQEISSLPWRDDLQEFGIFYGSKKKEKFYQNKCVSIRITKPNPRARMVRYYVVPELKEFLHRAVSYMKSIGYEYYIGSTAGKMYVYDDSRGIRISGNKVDENWPPLGVIDINFW